VERPDATDQRPLVSSPDYEIVIIDDHQLFSTALMISLKDRGFAARNIAVSELPDFAARPGGPDGGLVVLDMHLGTDGDGEPIKGYTWVRDLRARGWHVIVVTGGTDDGAIAAAIADGAAGALPKASPFDVLLDAILRVIRGEPLISAGERREWLVRNRAHQEREQYLADRIGRLTPREREVLDLLAEGQRAAAIAANFVVSLATVRTQIRSILTKLEVNSQLEAVALINQERS
jgi:DNA-binding NarL/FixJ family response regulator